MFTNVTPPPLFCFLFILGGNLPFPFCTLTWPTYGCCKLAAQVCMQTFEQDGVCDQSNLDRTRHGMYWKEVTSRASNRFLYKFMGIPASPQSILVDVPDGWFSKSTLFDLFSVINPVIPLLYSSHFPNVVHPGVACSITGRMVVLSWGFPPSVDREHVTAIVAETSVDRSS